MMKRKAQISLFGMIIIGIAIIAVLYLVQVRWIQKAFEVRAEAEIFIDVNDAKLASILKTRTGDISVMDFIVCELETPGTCGDGGEVTAIADKMDVALIIYDDDGKEKKALGKRVSGNVMKVSVPLRGGSESEIGYRSGKDSLLA